MKGLIHGRTFAITDEQIKKLYVHTYWVMSLLLVIAITRIFNEFQQSLSSSSAHRSGSTLLARYLILKLGSNNF